MLHLVQSYWACFGLHPSSCMWKTKYHNVSKTGSVSVLRWMGQDKPTQLGPLERASLNLYNIHHRQNPFKSICCISSIHSTCPMNFIILDLITIIKCNNERFLTRYSVMIEVVVFNFSSLTCFGRIDHLQEDIINIYGNH
jgi:hypothetical protein